MPKVAKKVPHKSKVQQQLSLAEKVQLVLEGKLRPTKEPFDDLAPCIALWFVPSLSRCSKADFETWITSTKNMFSPS